MMRKSEQFSHQEVGRKTIQGASLMVLRTLLLYPIGLVGEVCLARLLTPADFGIYGIASFITVTLAGVLEVGLAASLIQRQDEPRDEEYQTLFTLQFIALSLFVLVVFLLAPLLFPVFNFDVRIRWVVLALMLNTWVSSLGTNSIVRLERTLHYATFARMDVMRGLSYVLVSVPLAFLGAGAWSFVAAIVASSIVKTWVVYRAAPWPIAFRIQLRGMRKTLKFGLLFQLSTLTSFFRDHIGVVLGGPLFGTQAVGFLNWARNTNYYTSQIFTQVVSRVAFPSISRVQSDPGAVGKMTGMIFKYVNLFTFPAILVFAALIPEAVQVVFTAKWAPAIPAFYWFALRMVGSNITTLFICVLNALGQVKLSLRILVWWTIVDWLFSVCLIHPFGFTGIAMAYGASVIPISFWLWIELRCWTQISLFRTFFVPLLSSGLAAGAVYFLKSFFIPSWTSLALLAFTGGMVFLALLSLWERKALLNEAKVFLRAVMQREAL
jgi:teichuronic acid exporter